jgi:hypothetical protein
MRLLSIFYFLVLVGCSQKQNEESYPEQVGDITPDAGLDDPGFRLCSERNVAQYYNFIGFQFEGEKPAIEDHFRPIRAKQYGSKSGYITVRFVVNCKGESGRFRVEQQNTEFQPAELPADLVKDLLRLTKSLRGWQPATYEQREYDYYQYLTFKIDEGHLLEILP